MRSLRILWLWLATSFRAAPGLMTMSAVLVAARAITAPFQTYGVSRLVDGIAADQSSTIALGIGIIIGGLAVSFVADVVGWPLQDTAQERMAGRVHADLLDVTTGIPGLTHHERPDVADRLELVRERAWRMGVGAEVLLWVFATVTNTATVLTLLGSVHPLLLILPLLGATRIWSAYLSSTRQQKAWEDSLPQERLVDRLIEVAKDPRTGLELRVFGLGESSAGQDLLAADGAVPAPGRGGALGREGRRRGGAWSSVSRTPRPSCWGDSPGPGTGSRPRATSYSCCCWRRRWIR